MKLNNYLKGVWQRLFPVKDIRTALNIKIAMSEDMLNMIELWNNCYSGNAPWLNKNVVSLRLEKSIVREFANIVLNEMTTNITNPVLENAFNKATKDINKHLQKGLATGAMVIKPLDGTRVQFVSANAFIPIEYDTEGRLIKVVFPDFKKIKDKYYTRLEYHDLDQQKGLTITNTAYVSTSPKTLGREISLTDVEDWSNLEEKVNYPLMFKPAFAYYSNPIDNTIDGSHCAISIFEPALPIIQKADEQFSRLDWEFVSGERAIHADASLLKKDKKSGKKSLSTFNDRLYRIVNSDSDDLLKEFSPDFRQEDIVAGLEEYKRNIEFEVGLSYGDLSKPSQVEKTATEIKSSKNRKYNTVTSIQENLKLCLEDLVYALAFYNSLTKSGYKFTCTFKDSILTDEETERKQDIQDLGLGILKPEEYRAKWYGEDIETAKANLPLQADVIE